MRKQLIILGGGTSVIEGIQKGLFETLPNLFCFGTNYSHHYINTTCLMYTDQCFHEKEKAYLKDLPMCIARKFSTLAYPKNTLAFVNNQEYNRDCTKGVYLSNLTGIFALSLGIHILDEGDIFLLGYDYGPETKSLTTKAPKLDHNGTALTHWYQHGDLKSLNTGLKHEIIHRGTGKLNWYDATGIDQATGNRVPRSYLEYKPFIAEDRVKIYNVSMNSCLNVFEKITYDDFFGKLHKTVLEQELLRDYIRIRTLNIKTEL